MVLVGTWSYGNNYDNLHMMIVVKVDRGHEYNDDKTYFKVKVLTLRLKGTTDGGFGGYLVIYAEIVITIST